MDAFYKDCQRILGKMLAFQGESPLLKECYSCGVVLFQSLDRAVKQCRSQIEAALTKECYPGSIPGSGRSPGEGNGNHSSILAWKIPWTEEPGRLQSMGSQRVGHD